MAHRQWRRFAVVVAVLGLVGYTDVLAGERGLFEPTVTVRLVNRAGLDQHVLRAAKTRASEVFSAAGVEIAWFDGLSIDPPAVVMTYTMIIMTRMPSNVSNDVGVMGQAVPSAGRAYIYYDRVQQRAMVVNGVANMLGDVIAHELGHLLLPLGHSSRGIMRPRFDQAMRPLQTFTESEATAIKQRLHDAVSAMASLLPHVAN